MIARITGTVVEQFEKGIVLETNGIGYAIFTPVMPSLGTIATLFTHLIIREDGQELYGFETPDEKALFSKLINVSGVGPKTALQMLALYPISELVRIVRVGDSKAIALVPGIGKKTAEKIVIDLKDKLDQFEASERGPEHDLVEALLSLGYKEYQIRVIVSDIDPALPIQKQIAQALQLMQSSV
jgi:holliday junction DNA helicase RuvA